jgi:hypothetical protein
MTHLQFTFYNENKLLQTMDIHIQDELTLKLYDTTNFSVNVKDGYKIFVQEIYVKFYICSTFIERPTYEKRFF